MSAGFRTPDVWSVWIHFSAVDEILLCVPICLYSPLLWPIDASTTDQMDDIMVVKIRTGQQKDKGIPMEQALLRPEQAAETMNVSRTVIYELMRRGELDSVKIGRSRRIKPSAIVSYVERLHQEEVGA